MTGAGPPGCWQLPAPRTSCVAACVTPGGPRSGPVRTGRRALRLVAVALFAVPTVMVVSAIPGYHRQQRCSWVLGWLCRRVLAALHVRLTVVGAVRDGPALVVANHTSWLDVLALAAAAPMVPVAKSEVADWPVVGSVARRCGALFLRRRELRDLPAVVDRITDQLRRGHRVQVFPEATTRCGTAVDEFHRAGFQAALDAAVVVQPAAVRVTQAEIPTTATAFVGDDTLARSVGRTLRMHDVGVELSWLRPIPAIAGTGVAAVDRAVVARLAENAVSRALGRQVVLRRPTAVSRPAAAGWLPVAVRSVRT